MGILKYVLAVALGYALGRPQVAQLGARGRSAAVGGIGAVRQKVAATRPFSRSRDVHFPASDGAAAPVSLGGTTVMDDSEAAVLGTPVTPRSEPSTAADRPT